MRRLLFTLLGVGVGAVLGGAVGVAAGAGLALATDDGTRGFEAIGWLIAGFWLGVVPGAVVGGAAGADPSPTVERVIGALAAVIAATLTVVAIVS